MKHLTNDSHQRQLPDLSPAEWIWFPSRRCLANTFVLFRREIALPAKPVRATGWISADSRYLLEVNGTRIQWGPAPSDPRWAEADGFDLTSALKAGTNVLGATVLFYGHGDGTWPIGKPGFLFWMEIEYADGTKLHVVSDGSWKALLCRAWKPGHYKRWFLRALQEEFDARLYPYGWHTPEFILNDDWLPAMPLQGSPNRPALSTQYHDYAMAEKDGPPNTELRPRSIPQMRETVVPALRLAESFWLQWIRSPEDYFECQPPHSFEVDRAPSAKPVAPGKWEVKIDARAAALIFEFEEQIVGWPCFSIRAAAGTVVELLFQEGHQVGGAPLLDNSRNSWTRFICREGDNRFECFDFESLRWLQLHIHGAPGTVLVHDVALRRRMFPWPHAPTLHSDEPPLQRLFDASINTLHNCAQETLVDGMGRERQQYSGDGSHQLHAVHLAFGEVRLPARFLSTFSQGMTKDGYFLDCWPAYDRLARLAQRQLDLTPWGPILDSGIQFSFNCWDHYQYTGDLDALREPYPKLLVFANYLRNLVAKDGLLPVENIGVPVVWLDPDAYRQQRHKQCAFNLYAAAMLKEILPRICREFGDHAQADAAAEMGDSLLAETIKTFWSKERRTFINNLPWLEEEKGIRMCDRSLATAILYDQCPGGDTDASLSILAECPEEMGFSYPANAGWRLWALAKAGRGDVIVKELRERWATMESVKLNNTIHEGWQFQLDSADQWSHCAVAPIYIAYHGLAGIRPLSPGFRRVEIRPQLADLKQLELVAHTVLGPLRFSASEKSGRRELTIHLPPECEGEIILPSNEEVPLNAVPGFIPPGHSRYRLPAGRQTSIHLRSF